MSGAGRLRFADRAGALRAEPASRSQGIRPLIAGAVRRPLPLAYISDLMSKNYEAVGFIPAPRLEEYAARGQILFQRENDEPCGYLVYGSGWPTLKVYQCCIQYDARRISHASELVRTLVEVARRRNCTSISLWCADDLDANGFWQAMGFIFVGQRLGGARRGRRHNKWVLPITGGSQLLLFDPSHPSSHGRA